MNSCIFCNTLFEYILENGTYVKIYDQYGEESCPCGNLKLLSEFSREIICINFSIDKYEISIQEGGELFINSCLVQDVIINKDNYNIDFFIRVIKNIDLL